MSSSRQAVGPASGVLRVDRSPHEPAGTLAGLIDVLDRADQTRPRSRPRSAAHRAARPAPLRSVQPAPAARAPRPAGLPVYSPRVVVVPERVREPLGGLRGIARRMALWGAGDQGQHLAWRTAPPPARMPGRRRVAVRAFTRRMAMWGAGEQGRHLAWGRPASRVLRELDPPVVLRELPSTPSVQPVASSPAAALLPAGPASSPGSRTGTAAPDATGRPTSHPGPTDPAARSRPRVGWRPPRDWPSPGRYGARSTPPSIPVRVLAPVPPAARVPAPRSSQGSGGAGARGDPPPVRGSPRRTRPAVGTEPAPTTGRAPSSHHRPAPSAPS
ncbi:hypothetical protein [Blastococcus sp. SYSU DS0533]